MLPVRGLFTKVELGTSAAAKLADVSASTATSQGSPAVFSQSPSHGLRARRDQGFFLGQSMGSLGEADCCPLSAIASTCSRRAQRANANDLSVPVLPASVVPVPNTSIAKRPVEQQRLSLRTTSQALTGL